MAKGAMPIRTPGNKPQYRTKTSRSAKTEDERTDRRPPHGDHSGREHKKDILRRITEREGPQRDPRKKKICSTDHRNRWLKKSQQEKHYSNENNVDIIQ